MRIASVIISMGAGAYIVWKIGSPLPVLMDTCLDNAGCVAAIPVATSQASLPGLRVELYDPATEPLRAEENQPVWISSAESPWIVDGGPAGGPVPAGPSTFSVAGLGQPGAIGVCFVRDGGKRRCLAFIDSPDE